MPLGGVRGSPKCVPAAGVVVPVMVRVVAMPVPALRMLSVMLRAPEAMPVKGVPVKGVPVKAVHAGAMKASAAASHSFVGRESNAEKSGNGDREECSLEHRSLA